MPALVNIKVGSLCGTSGEEATISCPCRRKYSRKVVRISLAVGMLQLSGGSGYRAAERPVPLMLQTMRRAGEIYGARAGSARGQAPPGGWRRRQSPGLRPDQRAKALVNELCSG